MMLSLWTLIGVLGSATAFTPSCRSSSSILHPPYKTTLRPSFLSATIERPVNEKKETKIRGELTPEHITELNRKGYVVVPNFLPDELVVSLREDVMTLRRKNKFKIARIGQDSTNTLNTNIRVAETCFLGSSKLEDVPNRSRDWLYDCLGSLRDTLSGNPLLNENDEVTGQLLRSSPALDTSLSELLYAYYPKGGFYRRHVDAVPNSASILRAYSLLIYLNNDWQPSDGGSLRIHLDSGGDYLPEGEEEDFVDVEPKGSTLVLFKSDKIPHEVLDTEKERLAIVGWFNRPISSADISQLASEEDKKRGIMLAAALGLVTYGTFLLLQ